MNHIIFQHWELSKDEKSVTPDGASIHLDINSYHNFISEIYQNRQNNDIPGEYDRIVGDKLYATVDDELFDLLIDQKNLRLTNYQLNNLLKLKQLKIDD
jgi:hypothetical protein